jgi:hypothetical protein
MMSCKDGCVVEFEAFQSNAKEFIVKELAVTGVLDPLTDTAVVVFKPPYERVILNHNARKVANWLVEYHHGIDWDEGDVEYTQLHDIVVDVCHPYSVVYTKGLEKANFLRTFHNNVIDMNIMNAPQYDNNFNIPLECPVRRHKGRSDDYKCALKKSIFYAQWIQCSSHTRV